MGSLSVQEELKALWGNGPVLIKTPLGLLIETIPKGLNSPQVVQIIEISNFEQRELLIKQIFQLPYRIQRHLPGLIRPETLLAEMGIPAVHYPIRGTSMTLSDFLSKQGGVWTLKRLMGQCLRILQGIEVLHQSGRIHGAIAPSSFIVEIFEDNHTLWLLHAGLWEVLQSVHLSPAQVLGAGAYQDHTTHPKDDLYHFAQLILWIREGLFKDFFLLREAAWPKILSQWALQCLDDPVPELKLMIQKFQNILAQWESLEKDQILSQTATIFDTLKGTLRSILDEQALEKIYQNDPNHPLDLDPFAPPQHIVSVHHELKTASFPHLPPVVAVKNKSWKFWVLPALLIFFLMLWAYLYH